MVKLGHILALPAFGLFSPVLTLGEPNLQPIAVEETESPLGTDFVSVGGSFYDEADLNAHGQVVYVAATHDSAGSNVWQQLLVTWDEDGSTLLDKTSPSDSDSDRLTIDLESPRLNDQGQLVYRVEYADGPMVDQEDHQYSEYENEFLLRLNTTDDTSESIVGEGDPVPGLPGYQFANFGSSESPFYDVRLGNDGLVYCSLWAEEEISGEVFVGIWQYDGDSLNGLVLPGSTSPVPGSQFEWTSIQSLNPNGDLAYDARIDGDSVEPDERDVSLVDRADGTRELLLQEGGPIDRLGSILSGAPGEFFQMAFEAQSLDTEIWRVNDTEKTIIVAEGDRLDTRLGDNGEILSITQWSASKEGEVVYLASLEESVFFNPESYGEAILKWTGSGTEVIIAEEDEMPGKTSGEPIQFEDDYLAFENGALVLIGKLGDSFLSDDWVLIVVNAAGEKQVLCRAGDRIPVTPDGSEEREVFSFRFPNNAIHDPGMTILNDVGQFLIEVNFTDGSGGLFLGQVPQSASQHPRLELVSVDDQEVEIGISGGLESVEYRLQISDDLQDWNETNKSLMGGTEQSLTIDGLGSNAATFWRFVYDG